MTDLIPTLLEGDDMTDTMPLRIAGAPISWGVCEVPGWGSQLRPDKVLAEMRAVGLLATELGPEEFLPANPEAMATLLAQHGVQAVGGFTPLLLHVPGHDPSPTWSESSRATWRRTRPRSCCPR
jgi:inosose dehydratase